MVVINPLRSLSIRRQGSLKVPSIGLRMLRAYRTGSGRCQRCGALDTRLLEEFEEISIIPIVPQENRETISQIQEA
jgi:hypothetical protein